MPRFATRSVLHLARTANRVAGGARAPARVSRRLFSATPETKAAAPGAAWHDAVPYVSSLLAGTAAYFSTDSELESVEGLGERLKKQMSITAEDVSKWIEDGGVDRFRGAVLENMGLQAKLASLLPPDEFKLGVFKWVPKVDTDLVMLAVLVTFVVVSPIPGIRNLPALPRNLSFAGALTYAAVHLGSRYPVIGRMRELQAQNKQFNDTAIEHPEFASSAGLAPAEATEEEQEAIIQQAIQAELQKQQEKLKELPPLPEGLTMEIAKKLTQETTQVLMEQTAQAVATIRQREGIDTVEELRQRVASDPELVQKIYDETQRLERENETSKKVLESYGIEDGRMIEAVVAKFGAEESFVEHMLSLRSSLLKLYCDLGLFPENFTVDEPEPNTSSTAAAAAAEPVTPSGLVENLDTTPLAADAPRFIPAESFDGSRAGYVFTNGDKGLGYYVDDFAQSE